jgi:D-xylose transport system substrate-binding protein
MTLAKLIGIVFLLILNQHSICQQKKGLIGFLMTDLSIARWKNDRDFFISSAHQLGYDVLVKDAMNDPNVQIQQADELISAGVRALVVIPVDDQIDAQIVVSAHKAGVKVVAYDRIIMNCDLDAYVSYDNEMVGEVMAIYITIRKRSGTFAYIGGPRSDRNSFYIRKGIMRILDPMIKDRSVSFVCDTFTNNWSEIESYTIFNQFLNSGKSLPDVIFAGNDALARGVIKVLDERGLSGKVLITGQDAELSACLNLISGKQTLTIFKPIRTIADRAVLITAGILNDIPLNTIQTLNNGKMEVPALMLNPVPVDKNNLENTVISEGYHTREELFPPNGN